MRIERARAMRKAMSPPELALWRHLRALKAEGWHFRRQSPEGPYILDFVCRAAKLAVEVDGVHHAGEAQAGHDRSRDAFLKRRGFRVLRFWGADALQHMDDVMLTIRRALEDASPSQARLPRLARGGGRYRALVRLGLRQKP